MSMVRDPQEASRNQGSSGCAVSLFPLLLLSIMIGSGIIVAVISNWALPGDRLYPLKRAIEDARLELAFTPRQRLELEIAFDEKRLDEIDLLTEKAMSTQVDYSAVLTDVNNEGEWIIGGKRVIVTPETEVVGQVNQNIYVTVIGILKTNGTIDAERIQPREYIFTDKLNSTALNQWLVDGITITVAHDTVIHGSPVIGSQVRVKAFRLPNDQLVARFIEEISP